MGTGIDAFDVVVAGGGPAGLMAAQTVAEAGYRVAVFERESAIGSPVHTSGAVSIDTMRDFGIPQELYHPLARLRICSQNETAEYEFPAHAGCVIDVRGVYEHLGCVAQAKGAVVRTGCSVLDVTTHDGAVTGCSVRDGGSERRLRAKIVVDATGYRAEVSRIAGLHPGFSRFGVGVEYEVLAPHCRQDELLLIVGNEYAPAGYAWVFPWGGARVRVGVGLLHSDTREDVRKMLARLMADLGKFGVDARDAATKETHFGLVPAVGLARKLAGDGVVAVGDAAGVATLIAGEGIRPSLISGRMAGRAIAGALRAKRADRRALVAYERQFRRRFAFDIKLGGVLNKQMASWSDRQWDERVRRLRKVSSAAMWSLLQSHFSSKELLRQFARSPRQWPQLVAAAFGRA
ncbi:MAG: NAD(P)/FAD-dependent oxidoreductase [Candidatus Tyrphobacter sp.]